MGLGWLRAVAQGYNYSYNTIELDSIFLKKLGVGEHNLVGAWMAARGGARLQLQLQ